MTTEKANGQNQNTKQNILNININNADSANKEEAMKILQRYVEISDFKNIGVSSQNADTNDEFVTHKSQKSGNSKQKIYLNTNFKDDKIGGLVIIVGENNTGKSNVAKAIAKFSFNEVLDDNDKPNFVGYEECTPTLKLVASNGGGQASITLKLSDDQEIQFDNEIDALKACIFKESKRLLESQSIDTNKKSKINHIQQESKEAKESDKLIELFNDLYNLSTMQQKTKLKAYKKEQDKIINEIIESSKSVIRNAENGINEYIRQYGSSSGKRIYNNWTSITSRLQAVEKGTTYEDAKGFYEELQNFIKDFINGSTDGSTKYYAREYKFDTIRFITIKEPNINYTTAQEIIDSALEDCKLTNKAQNPILPQIIVYKNEVKFKNEDLITTPEKLTESRFFQALLHIINKTHSGILESYKRSRKTPGYLCQTQKQLNNKIKKILTTRFNKLYCKDGKEAYRFEIMLEETRISLSIYKGDQYNEVLVLDDQSEGFKWFFNLYFNLLFSGSLKEGDIVIMDEPAYNLSVVARKECRDFLKDYGESSGITFIVVTHDPFLLNIDHLDELRIIQNKEGEDTKGAMVVNDFSRINTKDTSALNSIKKAFGVSSHIFYPPDVRVILVEGIIDYLYLTTFKILKEREMQKEAQKESKAFEPINLAFLPINGLGKEGEEKEILKRILESYKDPILLTDADKAGEAISKKIKELDFEKKITHIKLNDEGLLKECPAFKDVKQIENIFSKEDVEKYSLANKKVYIARAFKKHILFGIDKEDTNGHISQETRDRFYKLLDFLSKDT